LRDSWSYETSIKHTKFAVLNGDIEPARIGLSFQIYENKEQNQHWDKADSIDVVAESQSLDP
jgi:hypothetical protein